MVNVEAPVMTHDEDLDGIGYLEAGAADLGADLFDDVELDEVDRAELEVVSPDASTTSYRSFHGRGGDMPVFRANRD